MSEDVKTAEEIAQDYTAMGHSVELINGSLMVLKWQMNLKKIKKIALKEMLSI